MIHSSRWRSGFIASALLLIWTIVFWSFLSSYLSMGPAFGLFFLTVGIFILMTLLMLVCVFFRKTRLISFGMAIPLLVLQIGLLILTLGFASWGVLMTFLANLPGCIALLVVGIVYLTRDRRSGPETVREVAQWVRLRL
jgi:hypothetical protein